MTDPNDTAGLARKMFLAETAALRAHRAEQEQAATDRAAALLAPIEAKVREHQARGRAEHRAAVLREAAEVADGFTARFVDAEAMKAAGIIGPNTMAGAISDELRRLADEAQQP